MVECNRLVISHIYINNSHIDQWASQLSTAQMQHLCSKQQYHLKVVHGLDLEALNSWNLLTSSNILHIYNYSSNSNFNLLLFAIYIPFRHAHWELKTRECPFFLYCYQCPLHVWWTTYSLQQLQLPPENKAPSTSGIFRGTTGLEETWILAYTEVADNIPREPVPLIIAVTVAVAFWLSFSVAYRRMRSYSYSCGSYNNSTDSS